jgi:OOP family OmpA-OmpF porin
MMKLARIILTVAVATAFASAAFAASHVDPARPHVDPKAPCFRWPAVDMDGDGVFDRIDRCVSTPPGCTVDEYGCHADADDDGVCDGVDQCPNTPAGEDVDEQGCSELQRRAGRTTTAPAPEARPTPPAAAPQPETPKPVSETERKLLETGRIRLENIYFETASARLLPESEASLREAGDALEKFPDLELEIEGHTDTRGSAAFNQRLSQARAEAVREYLLANFHLRAGNLTAKGYGETRPETRERNEEELLRNRRVEIRVTNPEELPKGVEVEQPR